MGEKERGTSPKMQACLAQLGYPTPTALKCLAAGLNPIHVAGNAIPTNCTVMEDI